MPRMTTTRKRETQTVTIEIRFTTSTASESLQRPGQEAREAGALAAFLLTLHPDAVTAALGSLGEVTVGGEPAPDAAAISAFVETLNREACAGRLFDDDVMPAEAGAPLPDAPVAVAEESIERGQLVSVNVETGTAAPALTPEQAFGAQASDGDAAPLHVASPVSQSAASELDAEGLPWDERIHSSNHKQSANGVWMKRRGVLPTVDAQVRAELR